MNLNLLDFLLLLLCLNIITFLTFGIDKWLAVHHKQRISEINLWLLMLASGGLGGLLGMCCFHHKTRKVSFYLVGIVSLSLLGIIWYYNYKILH